MFSEEEKQEILAKADEISNNYLKMLDKFEVPPQVAITASGMALLRVARVCGMTPLGIVTRFAELCESIAESEDDTGSESEESRH